MAGKTKTWDFSESLGLCVKAAFVPGAKIEFEDATEIHDVWFWFAAPPGEDRWFAFAMSDSTRDPDEMVSESDPKVLTKMAIFIGDPWDVVERYGADKASKTHRDKFSIMTDAEKRDVVNTPDNELALLRGIGEMDKMNEVLVQTGSGIKLSMN